ncbi:hypothetical protein VFPPC_15455 [Pochonia chlamydosporia 170]|uniref:Uncharacterized protein n=1 Tax=Pochonia chlamydosporia 170 TaxID=1380566 RepID=A0A179FWI7_METCM|nr:hypothetical protein VFPPC_15455 [Pochonia chlamydosporia 170]OAQ69598.1 hypothetical protein VFPPC_15455 [Pochonia chlamydosporia 170]
MALPWDKSQHQKPRGYFAFPSDEIVFAPEMYQVRHDNNRSVSNVHLSEVEFQYRRLGIVLKLSVSMTPRRASISSRVRCWLAQTCSRISFLYPGPLSFRPSQP